MAVLEESMLLSELELLAFGEKIGEVCGEGEEGVLGEVVSEFGWVEEDMLCKRSRIA